MSDIKEVRVAMTDADIEALSRPLKRRRTRKAVVGGQSLDVGPALAAEPVKDLPVTTGLQPLLAVTQTPYPVKSFPVAAVEKAEPIPTATEAPLTATQGAPTPALASQTAQTLAVASQPPVVGGRSFVKIQTRKRVHGGVAAPTPVNTTRKMLGAKISPVKRHTLMGTLKAKPKLVIETTTTVHATKDTPKLMKPVAAPTPTTTASVHIKTPTEPTASARKTIGGGVGSTKKRRFAERRLSISVKNLSKTRKARKSIRKQVAAMSVAEIRKALVAKGVLKAKSNPPEAMLRSMMTDVLTLKN